MLCWLTAAINCLANDNQRDAILSQISGAQIPKTVINIQKMGARGDGTSDCLPAFRKAFKKAARQGGARIVVPAGTYYIKGPPPPGQQRVPRHTGGSHAEVRTRTRILPACRQDIVGRHLPVQLFAVHLRLPAT